MIKKLLWLIKNQEKLEKVINNNAPKKKDEDNYSTAGVPDFQKDYVQDLLKNKEK